jgi:hypothetical protein
LVVGRPMDLASDPGLAPALGLLFPAERLDAFAQGTGVHLARTPEALIAGFDYATLYMVEGAEGARVQQRFRDRLVSEPTVARPHPAIVRIEGLVGATPQTLVRVDPGQVAVSVGSATPARIVELFALGKLTKSPPALRGSALATLPQNLERAPARFYAPGPFGGGWAEGARGLLAAALAVGIAARPVAGGRLELRLAISGDWSHAGSAAEERLREAWQELASSGTGRLLGLNDPASGPYVQNGPGLLELSLELDALTLARGLRAAVEADVWEILDFPRPRN